MVKDDDEERWEIGFAFVRANNNFTKALKEFGAFSKEERTAFDELVAARKRYNRMARKKVYRVIEV